MARARKTGEHELILCAGKRWTTRLPYAANVVISPANQANLIGGLLYINIHSAMFPGGEIRGQVLTAPTPCNTVPVEESTWGQIKELYRAEA